jgi:TRAP-type transport system small permease protein
MKVGTKQPVTAVTVICSLSRLMNIVAVISLLGMMLLTVSDVFLRFVFKNPISDSLSLTQYMMICTVFGAMAWCAAKGKHISVDLIISRFPEHTRAVVGSVTHFIIFGLCLLITWRSYLESLEVWKLNRASTILEIPVYPFYFVMTFGFALFCLVILLQLIEFLRKALKE